MTVPFIKERAYGAGWFVKPGVKIRSIPSAEAFGNILVARWQYITNVTTIGDQSGVGQPGVVYDQNLAPSGIASAEAFGGSTAAPGAVNLSPTAINDGNLFGSIVLTTGPVNVAPSGIASGETFGSIIIENLPNWVYDSSFETGYPNYAIGQTAGNGRTTEQARTGSYSYKMISEGATQRQLHFMRNFDNSSMFAQLAVNDLVYIRFWVRKNAANVGVSAFQLAIEMRDVNLGNVLYSGQANSHIPNTSIPDNDWVLVEYYYRHTDATRPMVKPYLYTLGSSVAGDSWYFDDVQIIKTQELSSAPADLVNSDPLSIDASAYTPSNETIEVSQDRAYQGTSSIKTTKTIDAGTTCNFAVRFGPSKTLNQSITPGDKVVVDFMANKPAGSYSGIRVQVRWYATGSTTSYTGAQLGSKSLTTTDQWEPVSAVGVCPPDCDSFRIYIDQPSAAALGSIMYYDKINVTVEGMGLNTLTPEISPTAIDDTSIFGDSSVIPGPVDMSPGGIPSAEAFGGSVTTPGAAFVMPQAIASGEVFGALGVGASQPLTVQAISNDLITVDEGAFEYWPWWISFRNVNSALVADQIHSGTTSLKLANGGIRSYDIPVNPGDLYDVEFWYYATSDYDGLSSTSKLRFGDMTSAANGLIAAWGYGTDTAGYDVNTWIKTTSTYQIPSGVTLLIISFDRNGSSGILYIDDVKITLREAPSPAISVGPVNLSPSAINDSDAYGAITVSPGPVTVTVPGTDDGNAFGTPTFTTGNVDVAPTAIDDGNVFGTQAISTGNVDVAPSAIDDGATLFGTTVVTPGEVTIAPTGIDDGGQFGTPAMFVQIKEYDTVRTAQTTPPLAKEYRVIAGGPGGPGGDGRKGSFQSNPGGGGGGGGAFLDTGWRSTAELGSTYTTTWSYGAAVNNNSPATTFVSGSVSLSAGGGFAGLSPTDATQNVGGGAGGVVTANIPLAISENGASGGNTGSSSSGQRDGKVGGNSNRAGPGGGGGSYMPNAVTTDKGGNGGSSAFSAGATVSSGQTGTNGTDTTPDTEQAGGGGSGGGTNGAAGLNGGYGGNPMAGGGGGGGGNNSTVSNVGRIGGRALLIVQFR